MLFLIYRLYFIDFKYLNLSFHDLYLKSTEALILTILDFLLYNAIGYLIIEYSFGERND